MFNKQKRSVSALIQNFVALQSELEAHSVEQAQVVQAQKDALAASELELSRANRLKIKVDELLDE